MMRPGGLMARAATRPDIYIYIYAGDLCSELSGRCLREEAAG